jgi:hypothetical protein
MKLRWRPWADRCSQWHRIAEAVAGELARVVTQAEGDVTHVALEIIEAVRDHQRIRLAAEIVIEGRDGTGLIKGGAATARDCTGRGGLNLLCGWLRT